MVTWDRSKVPSGVTVMEECEDNWTVLDMRQKFSDSPGSDDCTDWLCCRALKEGVEFAICAYESDVSGDEIAEIGCSSDTYTVSIIGSDTIASALDWLEWEADELLVLHVAASIPRR